MSEWRASPSKSMSSLPEHKEDMAKDHVPSIRCRALEIIADIILDGA